MEINLLDDSQLALLRQLTADASFVVVTVHKSPDGDAIGSMLAWAQYLQALGKEVTCVIPDAAPDFLMWLPGSQTLLRYDKHPDRAKEAFDKADLVCCLDYNDLSRTGDMADVIAQSKAPRLLIDHHVGPTVEAALSVSHPAMSSTSELVFRLLWQLGAYDEMTLQMAQCIYCGMMTDTGAFTYNSNAPAVYLIISHLLEKGVDKDRVYNRVYNNYSPQAIKFRSYVIFKKLRVLPASHAAYYTVTRDEMRRFQFVRGDLEGVVNIPQKIKNSNSPSRCARTPRRTWSYASASVRAMGSTAARWRRSSSTAEDTKTRQADAWSAPSRKPSRWSSEPSWPTRSSCDDPSRARIMVRRAVFNVKSS